MRQIKELDLGYSSGRDRLLLRLPVTVRHLVDADSPLTRWQAGPSGIAEDADSEIVVIVRPPPPSIPFLPPLSVLGRLGFGLYGYLSF